MNSVNLVGRLTRDPELRYIPNSGTAVSGFTLAVDKNLSKEKKAEMESKNSPTADFLRIVVWGKQAENCANFLKKGRLVSVAGRLQSGSYEDKDGKRVYTTDVIANNVQFLEWGEKTEGSNKVSSQESPSNNDFEDVGFNPFGGNDDLPF